MSSIYVSSHWPQIPVLAMSMGSLAKSTGQALFACAVEKCCIALACEGQCICPRSLAKAAPNGQLQGQCWQWPTPGPAMATCNASNGQLQGQCWKDPWPLLANTMANTIATVVHHGAVDLWSVPLHQRTTGGSTTPWPWSNLEATSVLKHWMAMSKLSYVITA